MFDRDAEYVKAIRFGDEGYVKMPLYSEPPHETLSRLMHISRSEARRLISQRAVRYQVKAKGHDAQEFIVAEEEPLPKKYYVKVGRRIINT